MDGDMLFVRGCLKANDAIGRAGRLAELAHGPILYAAGRMASHFSAFI